VLRFVTWRCLEVNAKGRKRGPELRRVAEPPFAADIGRGRPDGRDRPSLLTHRKIRSITSQPATPMLAIGGPTLSELDVGQAFLDMGPAVGALARSAQKKGPAAGDIDADMRRC
jgi:hypothetical protein